MQYEGIVRVYGNGADGSIEKAATRHSNKRFGPRGMIALVSANAIAAAKVHQQPPQRAARRPGGVWRPSLARPADPD
jgi:hypothetical protein